MQPACLQQWSNLLATKIQSSSPRMQDPVRPNLPLPFVPNLQNAQSRHFERRIMRTFVETDRNPACIKPNANRDDGDMFM